MWTKCPAQPRMVARIPEQEPSEPAMEGTCAAWVAEMVLTGQRGACADMIGERHENGWVVEPEMARHIQRYVDMVVARGGAISTERKVRLNSMIAGTPDAYAVVTDSGHLYVDDLKYGYDIVEPETPQIAIYAGAILRQVIAKGVTIRHVTLGIYQPRAYHPSGHYRTLTTYPEELMSRVHEIERAGEKCQDVNALAAPGDHCRRCRANAQCAASAHLMYDRFYRMHHAQAREMTAEELANELSFLEECEALLKGRTDAIKADAEARIKTGRSVPGYRLEHGTGNRRWVVDADTVRVMTGIDPTSGKMITPAEMERNNVPAELIEHLTEKPRTKARLIKMPTDYIRGKFNG